MCGKKSAVSNIVTVGRWSEPAIRGRVPASVIEGKCVSEV